MSKVKRKGRTLAFTVDELLESPRLDIALKMFDYDRSMLRAILIELGLECLNVAKYATTKRAIKYHSLNAFELKPLLLELNPDDFNTFSIFWGLSKQEQKYYMALIEGKPYEEIVELRDKALKKMGLNK